MAKPKTLLKQHTKKKKKSKDSPVLETADDFLAVGVEYEDSAGKWRAGDAVKALRFFARAVDIYDQGLARFPGSFDLAYNKARVQLEVATHPLLVNKLEVSVAEALERALESHQIAMGIDGGGANADLLFNTAQVLTALAEVDEKAGGDRSKVLGLLEEALNLLTRCWDVQEERFEEQSMDMSAMEEEYEEKVAQEEDEGDGDDDSQQQNGGGVKLEKSVNSSTESSEAAVRTAEEDQWFSVVEPVTKDTLIDTLLAQIGTLTTLCDVLASVGSTTSPSLAWIEEFSQTIINKKLPAVASDADTARQAEIRLAIARLSSSLLETGFRQGRLDAATFKRERDRAFDLPEVKVAGSQSYDALVANAESLAAMESAVAELAPGHLELALMRWQALASAVPCLATAAKLTGNTQDEIARTHWLRGDVSLHQYQMGAPPLAYEQAISNKTQLLKNAQVFYRNANKLYQDEEQKAQAALRSSLVQMLLDTNSPEGATSLTSLAGHYPKGGQSWVIEQIENMVDEGLLPEGFQGAKHVSNLTLKRGSLCV